MTEQVIIKYFNKPVIACSDYRIVSITGVNCKQKKLNYAIFTNSMSINVALMDCMPVKAPG